MSFPNQMQPSMRDRAVTLARNDFRVFKLRVNDKRPSVTGWPAVASSDPAVAHRMWSDPVTGESLHNNIGIATGGDFCVIDVDVKDGKKGLETLDTLIEMGLDTRTQITRSPTGSLHYYYRKPIDAPFITYAEKHLGPGIDTRGEGGYVVAPGSEIDGVAYECIDDGEMLDAPQWLLDRCKPAARPAAADVKVLGESDTEANISRAIEYLTKRAPEAVEGSGTGDSNTVEVARVVMDYGVSEHETLNLMLSHWNETKAHPPWSPQDLEVKVGNAARYRKSPEGYRSAAADFTAVDDQILNVDASKWRDPADLWAEDSEPPAMPRGVLPEIVEQFAVDRGLRLGVEPGAVAAAVLTSLGSLVSAGNELQMRQHDPQWTVKPRTWTMLIGAPGTNKSGTLSLAMAPLRAVEKDWRDDYIKRKRIYDLAAAPRRKQQVDSNTTDIFEDGPGATPRCRRVQTNDATTESMAVLLAENHGGMLYYAEELAGFLAGMDAYRARSGKDKPFYLQAKDGGAITVDRKTSESVFVPNLAVSVLGSIQNDKLRVIGKGLTEDGFLQRFIPVYIKRTGDGLDLVPDKKLDDLAVDIARGLGALTETARFKFTAEADAELQAVHEFKNDENGMPANSAALREWIDKTPNEFGRLALIFHFLEWFAVADGMPPSVISRPTAAKARRFLTEFVYGHAKALYGSLGYGDGDEHAQWIAGFILARSRTDIDERDIYRSYPALKRKEKRADIPAIMRTLEMNDWVTPSAFRAAGAAKSWRVNPLVHDGRFSGIRDAEQARRSDVRESIAAEAAARRIAAA